MISVIVPIYNVERYLRRALDSLLAQTYPDWEAILVDDGSTDGSSLIVEEYGQKDSRFKVIHQPNSGHSEARNVGMERAKGTYLLFLDSDDFLHPQLMELCIEAMERDDSDLVAFTYDRTYRTVILIRHIFHLGDYSPRFKRYKQPSYLVTDNIFDYATEETLPHGIDKRWAVKHCQVWRCMYKTAIVRDIKFVKGIIYEDFPWWSEVLLHVGRCTILNLPLYFYYPNLRSEILSSHSSEKIESLRQSIEVAKRVYTTAPEEKRKAWKRNFLVPFEKKLRRKEKH